MESGNKLNKKKLDELRLGPYKKIKKISDTIFMLDTGDRREKNYYHISKLVAAVGHPNDSVDQQT